MKKLLILLLTLSTLGAYSQRNKLSFKPDRISVFVSPEWAGIRAPGISTKMNTGFNFAANALYELGKRSVLSVGFGYS